MVKLNTAGSALAYGTFLGGGSYDAGCGIAVDGSGATYVTGITGSSDFPTTPGAFDRTFNGSDVDAFVVKLAMTGSNTPLADRFSFPLPDYKVDGYYFGQPVDGRFHLGEDDLRPHGTPVRAAANGVVKRIFTDTSCVTDRWGTLVIIEHRLTQKTRREHMSTPCTAI